MKFLVLFFVVLLMSDCGNEVKNNPKAKTIELLAKEIEISYNTRDGDRLFGLIDFSETESEIKEGFKSALSLESITVKVKTVEWESIEKHPDVNPGFYKKSLKWFKLPTDVIIVTLDVKAPNVSVTKLPVYKSNDQWYIAGVTYDE